MPFATEDHEDSMLIDAWRCSDCSGLTFDASGFEVPKFCCRCGGKFITMNYKDITGKKDTKQHAICD